MSELRYNLLRMLDEAVQVVYETTDKDYAALDEEHKEIVQALFQAADIVRSNL